MGDQASGASREVFGRRSVRVTAQDERTAVGGWEVDVEHLDGGKLVEHGPRGEAGGQRLELGAQLGLDLDQLDIELPQLTIIRR
jgi:hypothetical protein